MLPSARKRRLLFSTLRFAIAVGLMFLAIALGKGAWNMYTIMLRSKAEALETRERYDELVRRKADVERSLNALDTEYGREAALRERFGVARPGEVVIVLTDDFDGVGTATTTSQED